MEKKFAPAAARNKFSAKAGSRPPRQDERRHDDAPRKRGFAPRGPIEAEAERGERIAKRLARLGLASRREAEMMIAAGRVAVNGRILASPAVNVLKTDSIAVDGKALPAKERTRLWLYHKPAGLITTARDEGGRPTVFDNLPEGLPRVVSVGRLDMNTEGLLLLTNDGGLARILELPSTGWTRHYRARAHGAVTQKQLDGLKDGIAVDGVFYGAVEARLEREQGSNVWLSISLREGKNREIKNILGALGLTVNRLIRISFGPFQLADLEAGQVREVRGRALRDQLGARLAEEADLDFDAPIITNFPNAAVGGAAKTADSAEKRSRRRAAEAAEGWVSSGRRPRAPAEPRQKPQERQTRKANVWHAPGSTMRPARQAEFAEADSRHFDAAPKRRFGQRRAAHADADEKGGDGAAAGRKSFSEKPQSGRRLLGEKREFGDKRPFGSRKSASAAAAADRPFAKKGSRFAETGARREDGRIWDKNPRGKKPFGEKRVSGDKKPFADKRPPGKGAFGKAARPHEAHSSGRRAGSGGIRGRHADNRR